MYHSISTIMYQPISRYLTSEFIGFASSLWVSFRILARAPWITVSPNRLPKYSAVLSCGKSGPFTAGYFRSPPRQTHWLKREVQLFTGNGKHSLDMGPAASTMNSKPACENLRKGHAAAPTERFRKLRINSRSCRIG